MLQQPLDPHPEPSQHGRVEGPVVGHLGHGSGQDRPQRLQIEPADVDQDLLAIVAQAEQHRPVHVGIEPLGLEIESQERPLRQARDCPAEVLRSIDGLRGSRDSGIRARMAPRAVGPRLTRPRSSCPRRTSGSPNPRGTAGCRPDPCRPECRSPRR